MSGETRPEFFAEAQEILEALGQSIRKAERQLREGQVKAAVINQIFRAFHSLKGLASMMGYNRISQYTHRMEDLLDRVRLGKVLIEQSLIDLLYDAIDVLQLLLREISEQQSIVDLDRETRRIEDHVARAAPPADQTDPLDQLELDPTIRGSLTEYEEHRIREAIRQRRNLYLIDIVLNYADFDQVLREMHTILEEHGELISTLPAFHPDLDESQIGFRLLVATNEPADVIRAYLPTPPTRIEILHTPAAPSTPETAPAAQPSAQTEPTAPEPTAPPPTEPETSIVYDYSRHIRVHMQSLDALMNLLGELFILHAQQENLLKELLDRPDTLHRTVPRLRRLVEEIGRRLSEAQHQVLEMRLVPIGSLYGRLERLVRKLAQHFQKNVRAVFLGGETKLDKVMMDHILDPLVHIIRNAIDHGIEPPAERVRRGKPEVGTVRMEAAQLGNWIAIRITDDGAGIDLERVRVRGIDLGLLEDRPDLTRTDILRVIFAPGFSSAESVSEVSGRGIGLDIVKRTIEQLNGTITVRTEPGRGTTFEILLPITLAIISAILVRIGGERFAIPLSSVQEIVTVTPDIIRTVEGREVLQYHDGSIPLLRIARLFGLPEQNTHGFALVSRVGNQVVSLHVDDIERMQEIVIKRISPRLQHIRGISGAAEVGLDRPVLVLDPMGLCQMATQ